MFSHLQRHFLRFCFLPCIVLCCPLLLQAQEKGMEKQDIALAEQQMLSLFYETSSLPTRTKQAFDKLPTVMNVITAEQIRKMGARDLRDVLRLIPGLQIGMGGAGYSQVTMRGVPSHGAEKLKFMVDGHSVDISLTGGSSLFFADYPIDSVQKIEFLRGPGSALYGSDALLGVINIVTRRSTNLNKTELTARVGSFESQRYNLESGGLLGAVQVWGSANYLNSNGADVYVVQDGLSNSPLNSTLSNAPGYSSEWVERTTLNLSAETDHIRFQGQYLNHQDGGFFNPGMSLSDQTTLSRDYFWTSLAYENNYLDNQLTFKTKFSCNRYNHDYDTILQPAGFRRAQYTYANGMRSITEAIVDEYALSLQADGHFYKQHTITVGGVVKEADLHDVSTTTNFNPAPLPEMQDVSSYFNWVQEADRFHYGIFIQDQYNYSDKLVFLLGCRHDDYNDFGSAVSPNISAAYHFLPAWQFKLLYGNAFRAPSFRELYILPVGSRLQGNPELKAESVTTWQTALEWKSSDNLTTTITAYFNELDDTIATGADEQGHLVFFNQKESQSIGFDLELRGKLPLFSKDLSWFTILSYVDSQLDDGSKQAGVAPWLGSAGFDYPFSEHVTLNTTMHYTGDISFDSSDTRDEPGDYVLVDTALTVKNVMGALHGLDITWSIHNLFNQDYAYVDSSGQMPNHFPRPGISTELWLTYSF